MRSFIQSVLVLGSLVSVAEAHVSISSGPATANKSSIITFSVGHGCEDSAAKKLDTIKVKITIPDGVKNVRALFSDFGKPTLSRNGSNVVTAVEWTKPIEALLDGDEGYYEIKIRAQVPDAPFTQLKFDVEQTCQDSTNMNNKVVVNWSEAEGSTVGEPAPYLKVVPARTTGWNKVVAPRALTQEEVALYLGDALIVWLGNAAYSANVNTAALITATPGVTALDGAAAGDELWVRY